MINAQIPNAITILRLILVPILILLLREGEYGYALAVFTLAGLSDGLDGYLARKYHLQSELGGFLDPVADKVLMVSAYISLSLLGLLPVWVVLIVVARDFLIIGFFMMLVSLGDEMHPAPSIYSKINTAFQVLLVVVVLVDQTFSLGMNKITELLIYSVAVTTVVSASNYYWIWIAQRKKPSAE
jgi:cardiolipin synthase